MDRTKLINKVAAGLRRMDVKPDYLLFNDSWGKDFTWDESTICGIPVLHCDGYLTWRPYSDEDCLFIPCFIGENGNNLKSTMDFCRGYYDE